MSELAFTPTIVDDEPADTVPDFAPDTDTGFTCEVCSKPLVYAGKGRHPRFCEEHKPNKGKTSVARARKSSNDAIAEQAAETLFTTNAFVQFVAQMAGYVDTADAIDIANPVFKERALDALRSDPELAKSIARAGGPTARMALIMAYSMFAFAVVPVAFAEQKVKVKERKELDNG